LRGDEPVDSVAGHRVCLPGEEDRSFPQDLLLQLQLRDPPAQPGQLGALLTTGANWTDGLRLQILLADPR
jgi:hypothetical protein